MKMMVYDGLERKQIVQTHTKRRKLYMSEWTWRWWFSTFEDTETDCTHTHKKRNRFNPLDRSESSRGSTCSTPRFLQGSPWTVEYPVNELRRWLPPYSTNGWKSKDNRGTRQYSPPPCSGCVCVVSCFDQSSIAKKRKTMRVFCLVNRPAW